MRSLSTTYSRGSPRLQPSLLLCYTAHWAGRSGRYAHSGEAIQCPCMRLGASYPGLNNRGWIRVSHSESCLPHVQIPRVGRAQSEQLMTTRSKILRRLGIILFAVGVVLAMALIAVTIWTDLEASFFDSVMGSRGDEPLKTLRCPVLMTTSETGRIRASFENIADKPIELRLRAHVTDGFVTLMREVNTTLPLEPGEKGEAEFTLTAEDRAYRWLILARVLQFRHYPLPARQAACGVLVLDVPFLTGNQLFAIWIAVTVLCLGGGIALYSVANWPLRKSRLATARTMGALVVCLVVGFLVSLTGAFLIATILFAINVLLIFEIIRQGTS